jgi:hypothetical protein
MPVGREGGANSSIAVQIVGRSAKTMRKVSGLRELIVG